MFCVLRFIIFCGTPGQHSKSTLDTRVSICAHFTIMLVGAYIHFPIHFALDMAVYVYDIHAVC